MWFLVGLWPRDSREMRCTVRNVIFGGVTTMWLRVPFFFQTPDGNFVIWKLEKWAATYERVWWQQRMWVCFTRKFGGVVYNKKSQQFVAPFACPNSLSLGKKKRRKNILWLGSPGFQSLHFRLLFSFSIYNTYLTGKYQILIIGLIYI